MDLYFIIVSFNLFELLLIYLVQNINCRHLRDDLPLISFTYATFYTKLQIMTKIAYKNEPCFQATGRQTWLLFSVWGMSLGYRNTCFSKFSMVSFL